MDIFDQQEEIVNRTISGIEGLESLLEGSLFPIKQTFIYVGDTLKTAPISQTTKPSMTDKYLTFGWGTVDGEWCLYVKGDWGGKLKPLKTSPAYYQLMFMQRIRTFTKMIDTRLAEINRSAGEGVDYLSKYLNRKEQ